MSGAECVCRITGHLQALQFTATVRRHERREALLFMLYSIVEHGEDPTAAELSDHLFGVGRFAVTERLLGSVSRWGLAGESDGRWSLTTLGIDALRQRSILVPRDGVWHARLLDAGAVGTMLVTLEEVPASRLQAAKDETVSISTKQQASRALAPLIGLAALPADGGAEAIVEASPEPTGVLLSSTRVDVTWFPLVGQLEFGPKKWTTQATVCSVPELLGAASPELLGSWDPHTAALSVRAAEVDVDALFSRRLTIECANTRVDGVSPINHLELTLPCQPVDKADAGEWVARRTMALATQLQTDDVWKETLALATADLLEFDPDPPTKTLVAGRAKASGHLSPFWNLVAAADWRIS